MTAGGIKSWLGDHSLGLLVVAGIGLLAALLIFNAQSPWIGSNGGIAAWLQAIGSIYAVVAVSFPVLLERSQTVTRARESLLVAANLACGLMKEVQENAFDADSAFSEWWVPQWDVIGETLASAPVHDIRSPAGLGAFLTIRELYGRMRAWDAKATPWPIKNKTERQVMGNLCLNASKQYDALRRAFA